MGITVRLHTYQLSLQLLFYQFNARILYQAPPWTIHGWVMEEPVIFYPQVPKKRCWRNRAFATMATSLDLWSRKKNSILENPCLVAVSCLVSLKMNWIYTQFIFWWKSVDIEGIAHKPLMVSEWNLLWVFFFPHNSLHVPFDLVLI